MDAMHLHVLLYKGKLYLFLINYLFIIAPYVSCFYELYIVDKYLFIASDFHVDSYFCSQTVRAYLLKMLIFTLVKHRSGLSWMADSRF